MRRFSSGHARERREALEQLDQVVTRPAGLDGARQVADRGLAVGGEQARLLQERVEPLATGLAASTSGSTSSRAARRFTNVVFARRRNGGSSATDSRERVLLAAERAEGGVQVRNDAREVVAPLGKRVDQACRVDQELLQQSLVAGELAEQPAARRERRVQVADPLPELVASSAQRVRRAVHEVAQAGLGPAVEQVEDLIELDGGVGVVEADPPAVVDLVAVGRPELKVDDSDWRSPTARSA